MIKNKILMLSASILAVTAVSCHSKNKDGESPKEKDPVRVETLTVRGEGFDNATTYSGTIEEGESSSISFSTAGTIKQLKVQQGDRVAQGQVIGVLDDTSLKSAYEIANATLKQAQDAYDRMKILHDANSLPEIKWVDVQQKLVQAQNAADIARNALDDAVLRAPFSGVISQKFADLGQVVAPGLPVVKLVKINDVKAVISVPQNIVATFYNGDKAQVTVTDADNTTVTGTLTEKGVSANPLSRTYDVKFSIPNTGMQLLPGMICTVKVEGAKEDNAIMLPQSVVLLDEKNRNFVWLDSAGVARKRIVTVNDISNEGLEISAGLADGDKVIVKGMQKVCNGTKVESVN